MTRGRGAALVCLIAGGALTLPAATGSVGCGAGFAQDDAGSGRDAGDALAVALGLQNEGTFTGYVAGADPADWYAVDLPGLGEAVMLSVYPEIFARDWETSVAGPFLYVDGDVRFQLDAWAPGATAPTVIGEANYYGGEAVRFTNQIPGTWHVRIRLSPDGANAAAPDSGCPHLDDDLITPVQAQDTYALYYGCKPHCDARTA